MDGDKDSIDLESGARPATRPRMSRSGSFLRRSSITDNSFRTLPASRVTCLVAKGFPDRNTSPGCAGHAIVGRFPSVSMIVSNCSRASLLLRAMEIRAVDLSQCSIPGRLRWATSHMRSPARGAMADTSSSTPTWTAEARGRCPGPGRHTMRTSAPGRTARTCATSGRQNAVDQPHRARPTIGASRRFAVLRRQTIAITGAVMIRTTMAWIDRARSQA